MSWELLLIDVLERFGGVALLKVRGFSLEGDLEVFKRKIRGFFSTVDNGRENYVNEFRES